MKINLDASGYSNPSKAVEFMTQTDTSNVRPLADVARREIRSRAETVDITAVVDIPTVTDLERSVLFGHSHEPSISQVRTSEANPARSERDDRNGDAPGSSIEHKRPAHRNSAKHRFDELKINFLARYTHEAVKSVLFVGTSRGDGASTAAFNFANSLAQDLDVRVLFINADLRAPAASETKPDSQRASGLTSLANSEMHVPSTALHGNVHVLPSGRNYADPAVLFQSKRFDAFMAQVTEQFDYVVIDGPPLDEAPESIALSTKVDGVILVINSQHTRRKIALRAKKRIEEVGGKLLGVVLNRRKYYVPDWLYRLI